MEQEAEAGMGSDVTAEVEEGRVDVGGALTESVEHQEAFRTLNISIQLKEKDTCN